MLSGVAFLFFELCLHLILREYLVEGEEGEILLILQKIFEPIMPLQNTFEPIVVLFACKKKTMACKCSRPRLALTYDGATFW